MNKALIFDTETTGLPVWKEPSESDNQPHLVQLGALLVDVDNDFKEIAAIDLVIKPDDWEIPPQMTEIHGITTEYAQDVGVPEELAVEILLDLCGGENVRRVSFGRTFDQRIIRIATKRYFDDSVTEGWATKDDYDCAMMMSKGVMGTSKWPTLDEAYQHFTGRSFEGWHSAIADTRACLSIYREIISARAMAANG